MHVLAIIEGKHVQTHHTFQNSNPIISVYLNCIGSVFHVILVCDEAWEILMDGWEWRLLEAFVQRGHTCHGRTSSIKLWFVLPCCRDASYIPVWHPERLGRRITKPRSVACSGSLHVMIELHTRALRSVPKYCDPSCVAHMRCPRSCTTA